MKKKRRSGRPKGSKNKPKEEEFIIHKEPTKTETLRRMICEQGRLKREHRVKNAAYDYIMKLVYKEKKNSLDHVLLLEIERVMDKHIHELNNALKHKNRNVLLYQNRHKDLVLMYKKISKDELE